MKSMLFWQLRANYTQKKCPTPQPVTKTSVYIILSTRQYKSNVVLQLKEDGMYFPLPLAKSKRMI